MRVDRLVLKDFRGIRTLDLELSGPITVFAGANGSGKSTILQALAVLLWRVGGAIRDGGREREPLQAHDVRNGCPFALLLANTDWTAEELGRVDWGLRVTRMLSKATRKLESATVRPQANFLGSVAKQVRERLTEQPKSAVPLAVFYRTNRAVLDIPLRIKKRHVFDQLAAFEEALDGGWSSFRLFFEWFREREDLENEAKARSRAHSDPVLDAVRAAVKALMPDFANLRVQRNPLSMRVDKDGAELDIAQLSDGEKCLLAITADIARRLALANPSLGNPLLAAGVILIDEIELHLHPRWQRQVLPNLRQTFPNCQFVVSTHSPQVLASVPHEAVYLLHKNGNDVTATRPSSSYGRETNEILLELMGTEARPGEIQQRLDEMFRLIDAGELEAAHRLRETLQREIGADDHEFTRADMLLRVRGAGR